MENKENMLLDWTDSIEEDGQEFVLLPEGDYNFEVTNFERSRFPGGPKVPACNKAIITIQVHTDKGVTSIKFDLLLYRSLEWRISSFFRCIGQKKTGEKLVMNWNNVIGSKGRAHIKQRFYNNNAGEQKAINDVERFYDFSLDNFKDDLPF